MAILVVEAVIELITIYMLSSTYDFLASIVAIISLIILGSASGQYLANIPFNKVENID